MSLKEVQPGKYRAKAVEGVWCKVGDKQTPAVSVRFEFENNGKKETIWHVMYLTTTMCGNDLTVAENTFNNLARLGYNETAPMVQRADGNPGMGPQHFADKEVELVIDIEEKYHKVRYINELGGTQYAGMAPQQVLGNVDVRSAMAAARARLSVKTPQVPVASGSPF